MSALRIYLSERESALTTQLQPMWEEADILIAELAGVRVALHAINKADQKRAVRAAASAEVSMRPLKTEQD